MVFFLLLAMIGVPILEIAVFIQAGEAFGLWPTLGAVVLTALIVTTLLRWQGLSVWARATESLQRGVFPMNEVFTGLCLLVAGALLLTPGFITDAVGFALFVPAVRHLIGLALKRVMVRHDSRTEIWINGQPVSRDTVIDGEYETHNPESGPPNPDSPWNKRP